MKKLKNITFIKRHGPDEPYDVNKMTKFLERLGLPCSAIETLLDDFYEDIEGRVRAADVIQRLTRVAQRRITPAHPEWEHYAAWLFWAEIRNRYYNSEKEYPKMHFAEGLANLDPRLKAACEAMIIPEHDRLFNYKAAVIFFSKYCKRYKIQGELKPELPQHAYMRVAIFLGLQDLDTQLRKNPDLEDPEIKFQYTLQRIQTLYHLLCLHRCTLATPIMVNTGTEEPQTSSCVLMTVADTTTSILDTTAKIGIMSAHLAGVACNVQQLRAAGSPIKNGMTSGPIPFIKVFESTITAWNQGGTRPGALCIYFPWWHKDVLDLLSLRSNGGTEENRARRLKYAIKLNNYFIRAALEKKDVHLFSPHEVPELYGAVGTEFEQLYQKYVNTVPHVTLSAREIWIKIFKERSETGNIYLFHEENVNEASMLNEYIGSSNLCTEVVLPTGPSVLLPEYLQKD